MQFQSLNQIWHMDGHGVYVWCCWAMVFLCVCIGIVWVRQSHKNTLRHIRQTKALTKVRKQSK